MFWCILAKLIVTLYMFDLYISVTPVKYSCLRHYGLISNNEFGTIVPPVITNVPPVISQLLSEFPTVVSPPVATRM